MWKSRPSKWSWKYPPGAIQTREVLRDIIIEARKEKKAIRLFAVNQMGHIETYYITSKSQLHKPKYQAGLASGEAFYKVNCVVDHASIGHKKTKNRWFKTDFLCGSYSIGTWSSEHHRMFDNKALAEKYAAELKNDPEYVKSVHEHWERCDRIWGTLGFFGF